MPPAKEILIGDRSGKLVVTREGPRHKNNGRQCYCKCDCGKLKLVLLHNIRRRKSRSCGCARIAARSRSAIYRRKKYVMPGDRKGKLVMVKEIERNKYRCRMLECLCDCGNTKIATYQIFRIGKILSCGCDRWASIRRYNARRKLSERQAILKKLCGRVSWHLYQCLRQAGLKKKHSTFDILGYSKLDLKDHLESFLDKPCRRCSNVILTIENSAVDHIIPRSWVRSHDDIVWVNQMKNLRLICWDCNRDKSDKLEDCPLELLKSFHFLVSNP